jgi:hypothetical protein
MLPYPQPHSAMAGGSTRLSNKINASGSTNPLIWTALILGRPSGTCLGCRFEERRIRWLDFAAGRRSCAMPDKKKPLSPGGSASRA